LQGNGVLYVQLAQGIFPRTKTYFSGRCFSFIRKTGFSKGRFGAG
jgi:hypothetical protein